MQKTVKKRVLVFVLTVVVLVVIFAAPISAASSFPDSLANILDCSKLFSVLGNRLATSLVSFSSDAEVGTCSFVSSTTQRDSIASNYLGTIKDFCPSIKSGVWYTFHYEEDGVGYDTHFAIVWEHYSRKIMNGDVFMLSEEELTTPIFVECYNIRPDGVVRTVSHLAIIASPLPLSGSFTDETYPAYFNYDQEIDDTKQEFVDQVSNANYSIFTNMRVSCVITFYSGLGGLQPLDTFTLVDIPYSIADDGCVYLSSIFSYIVTFVQNNFPDYNYITADYSLCFAFHQPYENYGSFIYDEGPITVYSSAPGVFLNHIDLSKTAYHGYQEDGQFVTSLPKVQTLTSSSLKILADSFQSSNSSISVSTFILETKPGGAYYLMYQSDLCIGSAAQSSSVMYTSGYAQGYLDGQRSDNSELEKQAYDKGYNVGYVNGKKDGLSFASTGDWKHLFTSVVEVPVNTFQSLFNFEILGLDMRAAFGSLLALCVLLIVIKKVIL